jgi:hypothetical protein
MFDHLTFPGPEFENIKILLVEKRIVANPMHRVIYLFIYFKKGKQA